MGRGSGIRPNLYVSHLTSKGMQLTYTPTQALTYYLKVVLFKLKIRENDSCFKYDIWILY